MLRNNNEIRTYNVLFPLWFLIWLPSWLWLILIPLNYAIDTAVTWYTIRDLEDRKQFCLKNTWKICIVGFICDFVGSSILLGTNLIAAELYGTNAILDMIEEGTLMNPFANIPAFIVCTIALLVSAVLIYLIDNVILRRAGLETERAKHSAKWLAIVTAPYLFYFPSQFFYNSQYFYN